MQLNIQYWVKGVMDKTMIIAIYSAQAVMGEKCDAKPPSSEWLGLKGDEGRSKLR